MLHKETSFFQNNHPPTRNRTLNTSVHPVQTMSGKMCPPPPPKETSQTNLVLIQGLLDIGLVAEGNILCDEGSNVLKDSAHALLGIVVSLPEVGHSAVVLVLLCQLALHSFPYLIHLQHTNIIIIDSEPIPTSHSPAILLLIVHLFLHLIHL